MRKLGLFTLVLSSCFCTDTGCPSGVRFELALDTPDPSGVVVRACNGVTCADGVSDAEGRVTFPTSAPFFMATFRAGRLDVFVPRADPAYSVTVAGALLVSIEARDLEFQGRFPNGEDRKSV